MSTSGLDAALRREEAKLKRQLEAMEATKSLIEVLRKQIAGAAKGK